MLPNVLKYILEGVAVAFAVTLVNKKGIEIIHAVAIPAYRKILKKSDLKSTINQMISEIFCLFLIIFTLPFFIKISDAKGLVL